MSPSEGKTWRRRAADVAIAWDFKDKPVQIKANRQTTTPLAACFLYAWQKEDEQ